MTTISETAEKLGVSVEFLESQPLWYQEGRAPTAEEYTEWSRSQKRGCREYIAMEPLSHYQGMCSLYIRNNYRHCGVPFVSKFTCKTGMVEEGKVHHIQWKDFRRNIDRARRRGWFVLYICEECGRKFESGRERTGPKYCKECVERLRKEGLGPVQMLKKGGRNGNLRGNEETAPRGI